MPTGEQPVGGNRTIINGVWMRPWGDAEQLAERQVIATERIATALENVQRMFDSALTVLAEMDSVKGEEA